MRRLVFSENPRPVIASAIVSIIVPASRHFKFYKRVLKKEKKNEFYRNSSDSDKISEGGGLLSPISGS